MGSGPKSQQPGIIPVWIGSGRVRNKLVKR
jgi:hypothetical protein